MALRHHLKRAAENVVSSLAPLFWRVQRTPRLLVLMYHRVLPPEHPDRKTEQPGMYVSPQTLAMHLRVLKELKFSLVHLDDWLDSAEKSRPLPHRACAITFDDGWRDNYEYAYPVLKKAQASATIYLVSDLVGTRYSFWPNQLARILSSPLGNVSWEAMPSWLQSEITAVQPRSALMQHGLKAEEIDTIICECKAKRSDAEMIAAMSALSSAAPVQRDAERDLMSWAEIQEMAASGLIRFGSHTRRHTRLSGVSSAEALQDEVIGSRQKIEQKLGAIPKTFCYPNGEISAQAVDLVRSAYQGAVTTQKGWHFPQQDPFLIRRVGVHEDISNRPASFLTRISGWL